MAFIRSLGNCLIIGAAIGAVTLASSRLLAQAAPATQPAMSAPPSTAPVAVVPVDLNSPRGAIKVLLLAMSKGDGDGIRNVIYVNSDTEKKMVEAMIHQSGAENTFRAAATKAFGDGAKELVGDADEMNTQRLAMVDHAQEKIDGENAIVDSGEGSRAEPVKLKKVGEKWQIPASGFTADNNEKAMQQQIDDINFAADLMNQYAADVAAGKFKTADEAGDEIKKQMMVAMMKRSAQHAPATGPAGDMPPSTQPDMGAK